MEYGPGLLKASYVTMGRLRQTINEYANKTFGLYVHKYLIPPSGAAAQMLSCRRDCTCHSTGMGDRGRLVRYRGKTVPALGSRSTTIPS